MKTEPITIYQKPTCSTCRQLDKLLRESNVDYENINYYVERLTEEKLRQLLHKMRISARELLRTKESLYKDLNLAEAALSDDELIKAMIAHPDLIQRPIIEWGSKAILARPLAVAEGFLKECAARK